MEPIRTFEAKHLEENASLNSTWRKELELWNLRLKSQKKAISKLLDKGEDTSLEEERLLALLESEPSKKRAFKMLYEDATSEALFQGLHFNLPSAGLITSDGAGVLAGRAFNDLSKLNSIWSNDAITVDRASAESFTLNGARLSILIQAQEQIFSDYLEKNGKTALGSGLWARFLVCKPRSRIGTRFNANSTQSWEYRKPYLNRMQTILDANKALLDKPDGKRQTLDFSPEAKVLWHQLYVDIEHWTPTRFYGASDHASKLADIIARVAALMHHFEEFEGGISVETLRTAIYVCSWYSDEYISIFAKPPQEIVHAEKLYKWLCKKFLNYGIQSAEITHVRGFGPNDLRDIKLVNAAIIELTRMGLAYEYRLEGKRMLWINYLPPPPTY